MFTTFDVTTSDSLPVGKPFSSPTSQPRPKRAQVSRACDWCRLTRVKCDSTRPCRNCKQAKRECVNSGRDDFKSVAAATREVQRLRSQVQQLETKLLNPPTPDESSGSAIRRSRRLRGARVGDIQYGPSSLVYFTQRLSTFIKADVDTSFPPTPNFSASPPPSNCDRLQRRQQDALLDLYWQAYHAIYPVLEEAKFREHYHSLWRDNTTRQSCPLVDIVIALCIQFSSSYTTSDTIVMPDRPGYEFYLRSQQALGHAFESPTLKSVQCYFLSVVYLLAFNQTNTAYMMVRSATAAAESIGLQLCDDHDDDVLGGTFTAKISPMLWRCLITLDTQLSLHLGRPFAVPNSKLYDQAEPESDEMAQVVGPGFSGSLDINWLRLQFERNRLFQVVREIHVELMTVIEDVLEENQSNFYQHPSSREKCAKYLYEQLKRLKSWVEDVPDSLKTQRVNGVPFSVDRSPLDLSQTDPLWLQRQRLILELDYHSLVIMLTRTFNSFLPTPALGTFNSDNHCICCVNSGIMMTNILHQVIQDSEILTGWFQVISWQHTATLSLAGFACGYPICPLSPTARKTLVRAARVFRLANSQEGVQLAYGLQSKCLEVVQSFCARLGIVTPATTPTDNQKSPDVLDDSLDTSAYQIMGNSEEALAHTNFLNIPDDVWSADTPGGLLWGDLMKDLDSGLVSTFEHVGVND
ncbi:hypothetical protein FGRMN_2355 [Fusarium graminum]|nr:hypothetical protein FGRMN_2355 [Fusarium graminum]